MSLNTNVLKSVGRTTVGETSELSFRATVGGLGVTDLVTDGTAQEVVLPPTLSCKFYAIWVKALVPTTYDPADDCSPFDWSLDGVADGVPFDVYGKKVVIAKAAGESLGFVTAPAGFKIVVYIEY